MEKLNEKYKFDVYKNNQKYNSSKWKEISNIENYKSKIAQSKYLQEKNIAKKNFLQFYNQYINTKTYPVLIPLFISMNIGFISFLIYHYINKYPEINKDDLSQLIKDKSDKDLKNKIVDKIDPNTVLNILSKIIPLLSVA